MAFKMKGFKAHDMYEPKTGKKVVADTYQEHLELGKKGYTHKSPKQQKEDKKRPDQGTKVGQFTGAGIPETLYDADGRKINTNNIDEGNLSKIKVESGTNRKYVEYVEGYKAGGRLYFSNPK